MIAPAILTAVFIYWGWDTAVACNEESDDPGTTPGRAAVISTFLLLATYALVTVAAIAFAGVGTDGIGLGNPDNAADVFAAIGPDLFGDSVVGNDRHHAARCVDSDLGVGVDADDDPADGAHHAVDGCLQGAARRRSRRSTAPYLTPPVSTIVMGAVSIVFYVLFTLVSANLLTALIGSVGLMIAFYYGLTGFACVWFYRKDLTDAARDFMMRGVVPLLGGLILLVVFIYGLIQYAKPDWLTDDDGNNVTILGFGARGRGRYRRAGARRGADGHLVGHVAGLLPRPHPAPARPAPTWC